MEHFLFDYGMFFAKIFTLLIAFLLALLSALAILSRGRAKPKVEVINLNDKLEEMAELIGAQTTSKKQMKQMAKTLKKQKKAQQAQKEQSNEARVFVLDFDGDLHASAVDRLRDEITTILLTATEQDEVLVLLNSPGGMVSQYGLAASQLARIRERKIQLTVAIDKVAASGGYLMACVAHTIIAAPFAVIGSIGVVAQIPNFHRLLKKNDIDVELITAGEYKRTLTLFGENTEKAREKMKEDLSEIHQQFKDFIQEYRPQVDLSTTATGEHWLAKKAMKLHLVDQIMTSDDYLLSKYPQQNIYKVRVYIRKKISERLSQSTDALLGLFYNWIR